MNLHLNSVTAVLLLDSEGNRLLAKYYQPFHEDPKQAAGGAASVATGSHAHPFKSLKDQRAFEQGLFEKTRRSQGALSRCPLPLPRGAVY